MRMLLFGLFFFSFKLLAQSEGLSHDHQDLLKKYGVGALKEQAFCLEQDGKLIGHRVTELQRIASVTKLFTTLMAAETLDLHQTYKTTFYIGKDALHIEGGGDPYFEEEKLLLLIQELNRLGYNSFKKVTFDSKFLFSDAVLGSHANLSIAHTRSRLAFYLNPKFKKAVRYMWARTLEFASEEGVELDKSLPTLRAKSVTFSRLNPIKENALIYIHESRPLHAILKSMNVLSKNLVAQNIFLASSKVKSLDVLLAEKGVLAKTYKIYNGSGLPIKKGKYRWDNLASCASVIKVISSLALALKRHQLNLSDVIAVNGGHDLGSFRTRFEEQPETHSAVIAKTGTVNRTSTLAGVLSLDDTVPFAILNHTPYTKAARLFQDAFVARMFYNLGEPVLIPYTKLHIFPWDGSQFLREAL